MYSVGIKYIYFLFRTFTSPLCYSILSNHLAPLLLPSPLLHLFLSLSLSPHSPPTPPLFLPTLSFILSLLSNFFITTYQLALDKSTNIRGEKEVDSLSLLQQKANHTCSLHASTSSFRVELSFISCSFSSFSCRFSWSTSPNSLTVGYSK